MKLQMKLRIYSLITFFWLFSAFASAQNYDASKSLNKNAVVPGNVTVNMSNQSGDLKINTTDKNNVTMTTSVEIQGNSKVDIDKVIKAIEEFEFELRGNELKIDTRFYKNMNSTNNRRTITLLNGDKVKIGELKIRHEITIPKSAGLNLNNKYSDIELQSLDGHADFTLYSCNMRADDFGGNFTIEAKYSKVFIDEIRQNADINFYDSDLEFTSCGDAKITSKYSKLEAEKTGKLVIESYDDKFFIDEANSLKLIAKYSDFVSEANVTNISLELYDCNVKVKSSERATFNGKYSDVTLGDLNELKINDSYDNNIYLGNSKNIEIGKSKYTQFEIEAITNFSIDDLYDDNIKIKKLNPDFSKLSINGKYGKLDVEAGSVPFQVAFKIKYPKVNLPESLKIIKQIKDNSDLELVAGNTGGEITVEGYDMKVAIND